MCLDDAVEKVDTLLDALGGFISMLEDVFDLLEGLANMLDPDSESDTYNADLSGEQSAAE